MTTTVKRDKLDALLRSREVLRKGGIAFGSVGPDGGPSPPHPDSPDMNVAEILQIHEFGLGVPERPVVRAVAHGRRDELADAVKAGAVAVILDGADEDDVANLLGDEAQRLLLEQLDALPGTVWDEGEAQPHDPLQDSGAIRESLGWRRDPR